MNKFCLMLFSKEKERNLILMSFWRTSEKNKTKLFMQFSKEKEMYVIIIILLENFLDAEAKNCQRCPKLSKIDKIVKNCQNCQELPKIVNF